MAYDRCFIYQSSSACCWCKGWKSGDRAHKRGLNTKIHLAVDSQGLPIKFEITSGTTADCAEAHNLIKDIKAKFLLADRGYDTDKIIEETQRSGIEAVIPPKKNRKKQRKYRKDIYEKRHRIENTFLKLKNWRGIATRYAKNIASYVASVQICCVAVWLNTF